MAVTVVFSLAVNTTLTLESLCFFFSLWAFFFQIVFFRLFVMLSSLSVHQSTFSPLQWPCPLSVRRAATVAFTVIDSDGDKKRVEAKTGTTLLEALRKADVEIESPCNGFMACGMCRVHVQPPRGHPCALSPEDAKERKVLSSLPPSQVSATSGQARLACGVRLREDMQDMTVVLPPSV